jgi:tetratricopeptide (TPR) repeat protein
VGIGTFEEFNELQVVAKSAEEGRLKEALAYALTLLEKDPLHLGGLTLGSYCLRRLGANVQAYHLALAGVREFPDEIALWTNLGGASQGLWLQDEAESAYRKALTLVRVPKHAETIYLNLGALNIDCGNFDEGEKWIKKLLELRPHDKNTLGNLGFCLLARRDWAEGWKLYANCVGSDWLPKIQYKGEPQWDGTPGKVIAVYEDQGVGDAINFASCLPDAAAACSKVILDCEPKLYGLFKRSFPNVRVYPTRRETGTSGTTWAADDRDFSASIPLSQLPQFYRNSDAAFPGTPYLLPCAVRSRMWRNHFGYSARPVIGIAWTGGVMRTNARYRSLTLEELLPVFHSMPNAQWVSLQYKDAQAEIDAFKAKHPDIDLVQYPFATLTKDYDDTAAMVSALDYVVAMQTAVAHLAGALGIPNTVMVPTHTTWRYAVGDSVPWYKSMKVVRQEHNDWASALDRVCGNLKGHFGELPQAAGTVTRNGAGLRDGGSALRGNGRGDRQKPAGLAST